MAQTKFVTFLHKNTNKFTLILIYTLLEWILIILLLTNSLLSYIIIKFTDYFGLKKPCPLCTKIDHVLEPGKAHKFHRDLLCKSHSRDFNLTECSCCGFTLERENYSPCIVIKPSLDILDYTKNGDFVEETEENREKFIDCSMDRYEIQERREKKCENQSFYKEDLVKEQTFSIFGEENEAEDSKFMIKDPSFGDNLGQIGEKEDVSTEIISHHLEFFVGQGGYSLIPVDLIDLETEEKQSEDKRDDNRDNFGENFDFLIEENEESLNFHPRDSDFLRAYGTKEEDKERTKWEPNEVEAEIEAKIEAEARAEEEKEAEAQVSIGTEIPDLEETNEESLNFHPRESDFFRAYGTEEEDKERKKWEPTEAEAEAEAEAESESEAEAEAEAETEVSIGTEIPDLEEANEIQDEANLPISTSLDDASSTSLNFHENEINGVRQVEKEPKELNTLSIDVIVPNNAVNLSDNEEDKIPDTPTSIDSLLQLHKKLLMLEKREPGAEESLDTGVACELEDNDELKSALKAERKALETLYLELEEERSASAIAAKESMAMITRLQEEKAAIKMESLQYQRMTEEQSEYDQEALHLLNELLVKREKEKEALERELEVYRKKFRLLRSFSGSSSNHRDSFGLANGDENGFEHSTPVDEVLDLDESLGDLENERISILEQLESLEEKLFTMSDNDENVKHQNGFENGYNTKRNRIKGIKGKRLLPLFDESENGDVNGYDSHESDNFSFENERNEIDEEIDQLYCRVQALEEDNEFLKHCISSLKKGDKGLDLLQEILQHLRDLRNVELLG